MPPKPTAAAPAAKKPAAAKTSTKKIVIAPSIAASRPLVSVHKIDEAAKAAASVVMPNVFVSPIRPDIIHFVHTNIAKNHRQAYSVSASAGMQHSAESWGTGRAVARIPRVSGGGTSRAGQAAFGNMCRAGRLWAPTKTWRRWHRKVNVNQKRFAVASALAASALPGLVLGRGHAINSVPEIPLVVDNSVEAVSKTKSAILALKAIGAYDDVLKAKNSVKLRAGKGKMRGRRHTQRLGPLIVYENDGGLVAAFRNLSGVECAHVDRLNLLQLAPGGHVGRFVVWSQNAFKRLNSVWGSVTRESAHKVGYTLPRPLIIQSDISRIINSDEIQSKVRAPNNAIVRKVQKKNPLTNFGALVKLNPYAVTLRRAELLSQERRAASKAETLKQKRDTRKSLRKQKSVNFHRLTDEPKEADAEAEEAEAADEE